MIIIIVAISENNVIGKDGKIPWHIPEDLKRFRTLTMGNTVLMGRKTFESLGKPLDGRENIVITRNTDFKPEGVKVFHSFEEAVEYCKDKTTFVIGGQSVYEKALPIADRIEMTKVHKEVDGDTFFPSMKGKVVWVEATHDVHEGFTFITYVKQRLF